MYSGWLYFYFQDVAEDILETSSPAQHEVIIHEADTGATKTSNTLMDVHDE